MSCGSSRVATLSLLNGLIWLLCVSCWYIDVSVFSFEQLFNIGQL